MGSDAAALVVMLRLLECEEEEGEEKVKTEEAVVPLSLRSVAESTVACSSVCLSVRVLLSKRGRTFFELVGRWIAEALRAEDGAITGAEDGAITAGRSEEVDALPNAGAWAGVRASSI